MGARVKQVVGGKVSTGPKSNYRAWQRRVVRKEIGWEILVGVVKPGL